MMTKPVAERMKRSASSMRPKIGLEALFDDGLGVDLAGTMRRRGRVAYDVAQHLVVEDVVRSAGAAQILVDGGVAGTQPQVRDHAEKKGRDGDRQDREPRGVDE